MSQNGNTNNIIKKGTKLKQPESKVFDSATKSKLNPNENLKMEMKREYDQLLQKENKLDKELALLLKEVKEKQEGKSSMMEQLHVYNDVKDVTQIVLGSLARLEDITVTELHERFGLSYKDNDA